MTAAGAVRVRFIAGVASFAGIGNLHALAQQAEEALYRAKASGRDRIETMDPHESRGSGNDIAPPPKGPLLALA